MLCLLILIYNTIAVDPYTITVTTQGCVAQADNKCTRLCRLGIADCSGGTLKCEYGYFQYEQDCILCPYQGFQETMILSCMDCVENPYNWQTSRKCTYYYRIQSGNPTTGAYIKLDLSHPELYFVQEAVGTSTASAIRDVVIPFEVQMCSGCQEFCDDQDNDNCHYFDVAQDMTYAGVICKTGYYFEFDTCQMCVDNCATCTGGLTCNTCSSGYALLNGICQKCFIGCNICEYNSETEVQQCYSCEKTKEQYTIAALDQGSCVACEDGCSRCEFTSYSDDIDEDYKYPSRMNLNIYDYQDTYIKRCRQCSNEGYFIGYDGISCTRCEVDNCQLCYYDLGGGKTTMDSDFTPKKTIDSETQYCFICKPGYQLSASKEECTEKAKEANCVVFNAAGKCDQCQLNAVLELYSDPPVCETSQKCNDKIKNCAYCYSYIDTSGKPSFQCMICEPNYYADLFTGVCIQCSSHCTQCWSYTDTYNITAQVILKKYTADTKYLLEEPVYESRCTNCLDGYDMYGNTCMGCTENCYAMIGDDFSNVCEFRTEFAYCTSCFIPQNDRSLTPDMSECQECPTYCQACRIRSQDEIAAVNPLFDPSSSALAKFSRLCYKLANINSNTAVYIDTMLGVPVQCKTGSTALTQLESQAKCRKSTQLILNVQCEEKVADTDYLLSDYFKGKLTTAKITFKMIENTSTYAKLNEATVQDIELIVKFISKVLTPNENSDQVYQCTFPKPTEIVTFLQKNVFSLSKLKIFFIGVGGPSGLDRVQFNLNGWITFNDYSNVQIKNININSISLGDLNKQKAQKKFGIEILGKETNVEFIDSVIGRFALFEPNYVSAIGSLNLQNSPIITLTNVKFFNIYTKDTFLNQTMTLNTQFNKSTITLTNVELIKFEAVNKSFINMNIAATDNNIIINNLLISQTKFTNVPIFSESQNSNLINFKSNKITSIYSIFTTSGILNSQRILTFQGDQTDIVRCNFIKQSSVFSGNSINVNKLFVSDSSLSEDSILLMSTPQLLFDKQIDSIKEYKLSNINFDSNKCLNINCLMKFSTPYNLKQIRTKITISSLQIINIDVGDLSDADSASVNSALVKLNRLGKIVLNKVLVDNTHGITIFYIDTTMDIQIFELTYDWSSPNIITRPPAPPSDEPPDEIAAPTDEGRILQETLSTTIVYPINNLIPTSYSCATRKLQTKSYSSFLLYIQNFEDSIFMESISILRQLFIDSSAISIISYDTSERIASEVISLQYFTLGYNSLVSLNDGVGISLITIQSPQQQSIQIQKISCQSNHLHQLTPSQTAVTTTVIMIDSAQSKVILLDSTFQYNRATKSEYGLIWVQSKNLYVVHCQFTLTNAMDTLWISRLEEQQMKELNTTDNLKSYFEILSQGANIYAISTDVIVSNSYFSTSYGIFGASLYLKITSGSLQLNNTVISNAFAFLQPKYSSQGGCLYVDSSDGQLTMIMQSVQMINCTARVGGGCIFITPTKFAQNITIIESLFSQCQSLGYTFLDNQYVKSSTMPTVKLDEVTVIGNNFDAFIENLPSMTDVEMLSIQQNYGAMIQITGFLTIKNSDFTELQYGVIIKAIEMTEFILDNVAFEGNTLYLAPLINLQLLKSQSVCVVVNSAFRNNTSIETIEKDLVCQFKTPFSYVVNEQTCENVIENQVLIDQINNYYEKAFEDASYKEKYQVKSSDDKYTVPFIPSQQMQLQDDLVIFFDPLRGYASTCVLTSMLYKAKQIDPIGITSLFYLDYITSTSLMQVESITITSNFCPRCFGGLWRVQNIMQLNDFTRMNYDQINCQYNFIGYYGCMAFTKQDSFVEIIPSQDIIDSPMPRLLQANQPHILSVTKSQFQNNNARVGASIVVFGVNTLIQNCKFTDNHASLIGGAIYFDSLSTTELFVQDNIIEGNQAQVGGGIFLKGQSLAYTDQLNVHFDGNQANSSQNLLEETRRLTIQMVSGQYLPVKTYMGLDGDANDDGNVDSSGNIIRDTVVLHSVKLGNYPELTDLMILPSGQSISKYRYFYEYTQEYVPFEWVFRLINLNRFNEPIVNADPEDICQVTGREQKLSNYNDTILFTKDYTLPQKFLYSRSKGGYDLDNMIVTYDPKSDVDNYLELKFTCESIQIPLYNPEPPYEITSYNQNYQLITRIRTFPCQKGEVYTFKKCSPCDPLAGQYNVVQDANFCSQMDQSSTDEIKQSSIRLKPGWWRPAYDNNEPQFCENLESSCKGGWVPGDASCYEGHIGALCESCDIYAIINEDRFTQTGPFKCAGCKPTEQLNIIMLTVGTVMSMFTMVTAVQGSLEEMKMFIVEQTLTTWGYLMRSSASDLATLMKVLTNYFQIVQFITQFQIAIPAAFTSTASTAGNPTETTSSSLDCLLVTMVDVDLLYFRMIWALVMPASYLIGFFIGYFLVVLFRITQYKTIVISTALIYQFLYLQPTMVESFIVLASSRTVSGLPWVQKDVAYRYDTETHQMWLIRFIAPLLFVWVLFLPLLFMFLLWRNKDTLDSKPTKMTYGFFYNEYETNSYLWEFVKMFQKSFMVIILSYYEESIMVKGMLLVAVMFLYGSYQVSVDPYKNRRLNNIDRFSTVILAITLCLGVLMYSAQNYQFDYLVILIFVVIVLINLPFLILIFYYIFEGYIIKLSTVLDVIRDKINEKYPNLSKKHPFIRKLLINKANMDIRVKYLWGQLRTNVWDSVQICHDNNLKFNKVFPPYNTPLDIGIIALDMSDQQIDCQLRQQQQPAEHIPILTNDRIQLQDGSVIQGTFREGMFTNRGVLTNPSGVIFQGTFMNQQQHGVGMEQWPDNTKHEGVYKDGKKYGPGKIIWPDKEGQVQPEMYEGNFEDDKFHGLGTYRWSDGRVYEGHWKYGVRHGFGKYLMVDKREYEGEFADDQFNGLGSLRMGQKSLKGKWENGKLQGEGEMRWQNKSRRGEWKDGQFVKWLDKQS